MAVIPLVIKDEDVALTNTVTSINFTGPGVSATTDVAGNVQVEINGCDSALAIQNEGIEVVLDPDVLNFVGSGVTAALTAPGVVTVTVNADPPPVFPTVINPSLTYPFASQNVQISDLELRASPFIPIPPAAVTHVSTGWQVALDPLFTNIVFESQPDTVNKTSITPTGVFVGQSYYARVRYYGSDGFITAYSTVLFFTVIADIEALLPGQFILPNLESEGLIYIQVYPDYSLITGDGVGSGMVAKTTDFATFLCRRTGNGTSNGEFDRKGSEILITTQGGFHQISQNNGETYISRLVYPYVGGTNSSVSFVAQSSAASANKFFVTGRNFSIGEDAILLSAATALGPWTVKDDFPSGYDIGRAVSDGGSRLAISFSTSGSAPFFLFSEDDGVTFTELALAGIFPPLGIPAAKFLNGRMIFIAGGQALIDLGDLDNPIPVFYSIPTGGTNMTGLTYGGGFYYVCGPEGKVFRSANFIAWTPVATGETSFFFDCAYKDGVLILVRLFGGLKYIPVG